MSGKQVNWILVDFIIVEVFVENMRLKKFGCLFFFNFNFMAAEQSILGTPDSLDAYESKLYHAFGFPANKNSG